MQQTEQLNSNNVELLNDAGSEYTTGTKLHFKLRLKARDYKGELLCILMNVLMNHQNFCEY